MRDAGRGGVRRSPARGRAASAPKWRLHQLGGRAACSRCPAADDHDVAGVVDALEERRELVALEAPRRCCFVPRMGRPSGWSGQKASVKSSITRSSGVSSTMLISSKMTFFSLAISTGSKSGFRTMSPRMSTASGQVLVEHLQVEGRVLLGGEGVHVAADRVHLGRDVLRRAVLRSLEDHVLDEVADPGLRRGLVAAAPLEPHPDGHAADVGHRLGEEGEAVGEDFLDDHGSRPRAEQEKYHDGEGPSTTPGLPCSRPSFLRPSAGSTRCGTRA